jgi:hypothetical protein
LLAYRLRASQLLYALAGIELENVRAVLVPVEKFDESAPNVGEFPLGQPAFKERFLSAGFVSDQKMTYALKPAGIGDVVANEVEDAGGIGHARSVGRKIRLMRRGKLVIAIFAAVSISFAATDRESKERAYRQ